MNDEDKLFSTQRRTILTHVPADVRMRVCEELKKKKKMYFISAPILIGIVLAGYTLLNYMLGGDMFIYGYIAGCGVMTAVMLIILYMIVDRIWLPPTAEEMEEIGDDLI